MNIMHRSRSDSWYTPDPILALVRTVIGDITFDPASCAEANERVRAGSFLTRDDDALVTPWPAGGSWFLNPPGGKRGGKSLAALFWKRLMAEKEKGSFDHAVFLGFSAEILAVAQNYSLLSPLDFPICIPRKRIAFEGHEGKVSPSHSNVIVYVPGKVNASETFLRSFKGLGACR